MKPFLFSVPSGEPVELEPFHYAIIGQTQFSGKTTLVKRLASWVAEDGYRVLIFDTKETEADYEGFGREISVCLRETTDSFVLIGLLESFFRRRLTQYYATLSRITEGATNFEDMIRNARELESTTRSSWLKDACRTLYDLLARLQADTAKVETVPKLKLHRQGISRMVINDFSQEAQQLIVKNSVEDVLRVYKKKVVVVLDEAFKFLPQGYSSAATRSVMNLITQGAKTGLYVWISTQFLATTDKDPLKACAFKFLGTQDHITEVKHTLALIPEVRGKFDKDDIMKLSLGQWILVRKRPRDARIVYALPEGVPFPYGKRVATGELTAENIRDQFLLKTVKSSPVLPEERAELLPDKVSNYILELNEAHADLQNSHADLQKKHEKAVAEISGLNKECARLQRENSEAEKEIKQLISTLKIEKKRIKELETDNADLNAVLKVFNGFKSVIGEMFIQPAVKEVEEVSSPLEISVDKVQPVLSLTVKRTFLELSDRDVQGRFAILYAEGIFEKWISLSVVNKALLSHAWSQTRTVKHLNQMAQWGFLEKKMAGNKPIYKQKMSPEEAREKGLLVEKEI